MGGGGGRGGGAVRGATENKPNKHGSRNCSPWKEALTSRAAQPLGCGICLCAEVKGKKSQEGFMAKNNINNNNPLWN